MGSELPKIMSYQRDPSRRTVKWASRIGGKSLQMTGCSEYICRQGRAGGGNWTAIHNFVDVERFAFVRRVPDDAPLVFLSRVEWIKGPHLAIDAARQTGRRLIIAGNHSATASDAEYWRTQIEPQLGRDGVEYIGPVDDRQKNELLGRAAALMVPIQWNEPFGIVFAEALACGTPVISCPRGALPEIIRDEVEGFLTNAREGLVGSVERLGRIDRAACRARAERAFSLTTAVGQYERLYKRARCNEFH
jgi:glycosyltransferase involved in cell wall biosynthesis